MKCFFLMIVVMVLVVLVLVYDGMNCKVFGNCWELKLDYFEWVEGLKYDLQYDLVELLKQGEFFVVMDVCNVWWVWNMKKIGSFEYDVKKIDGYDEIMVLFVE